MERLNAVHRHVEKKKDKKTKQERINFLEIRRKRKDFFANFFGKFACCGAAT